MKETISIPVQSGAFQSIIDCKRLIVTKTSKACRIASAIIRNDYTPWILTAIITMLMCYGFAINNATFSKLSAIAIFFPFAWGIINELKNTNTEEL